MSTINQSVATEPAAFTIHPSAFVLLTEGSSMSRHNTPYPDFGRLAIRASKLDSNAEMPATTRSAARRQQASSGSGALPRVTAGPSRTLPGATARQSFRQSARQQRAATRPGPDDGNDSESSEDEDTSDDDEENVRAPNVDEVFEIYAIFTDTHMTPNEFSLVDQPSTRDERDGRTVALTTALTQNLRRLAAVHAQVVTREPQLLQPLRVAVPKAFRLQQLVVNMAQRLTRIQFDLHNNVNVSAAQGRNVPDTVDHCRWLYTAIDNLLHDYANNLREVDKRTLVNLLFRTLHFLTEQDLDRYAQSQVARPPYASTSSGGNLYRRWISQDGQPGVFLYVLNRLPPEYLQAHRHDINTIHRRVVQHDVGASDRRLLHQVVQGLHALS